MTKPLPDETSGAWGKALRKRRKALGISMQAAADAAGMSRLTWRRLEQGEPGVALGFMLSAVRVLGMNLQLELAGEDQERAAPPSPPQWLPLEIHLADYPGLQRLAWQLRKGVETLTPREAWELYERNGRHLDAQTLSPEEKALMRALHAVFGGPADDV